MHTSTNGMEFIKGHFEKLRLRAYWDSGRPRVGKLTIGWGHTGRDVVEGMIITRDRADELFARDIMWVDDAISDLVDVELTQTQYDALASFVFNIGATKFQTSTLLHRLNLGLYQEAADEMLRWHHDNGVDVAGLVTRREMERRLFLNGTYN